MGNNRNLNELTSKEWIDVISQIPRYAFVTLVGGEVFLRKDFFEILDYSSKRFFGKVSVVSNGTLTDSDSALKLIKSKIMLFSVSLDGFGKNHDINRNGEGIFDKVVSNLDYVNSIRKKSGMMIDVKTLILQNNLEDLPELYKYCTQNRFEFFSLAFLRNSNLKSNSVLKNSFESVFYEPSYDINPYFDVEHFIDVYKKIYELSKHSETRIRFSPKFEGGTFEDSVNKIRNFFAPKNSSDLKRHPRELYYPCKYPFSNMMINPAGDVYPCLSFKTGNVKESSIKELFNTDAYRQFRKKLKNSGNFSSCQMCCELKVKNLK